MKILHILDHSLPLHSGYTFRSQNIFTAQKNMGYDPIVLTSPKHEESLKKASPLKETINAIKYYRTGQVNAFPFPMISELHLMHRLYKRILQVASMENPGIIHAHSPILNGIPAIRAARKLNIPVVYEIRAFWEDAAVDHGTYQENSWKYNLTKFIETRVCKKVDHVCILCNGLKNDLIKRGLPENKITPVFNAISPEELQPVAPDKEYFQNWNLKDKTIIGFIGSFYRYEGLDLLIESFSRIASHNNNAVLLLVGGGEMESELTAKAEKFGIKDKVIMPGRIPHERIAGVYSLIDILAYPRYSMRLTELVTPLKPLEAMAMGKAFVASDVGGHKELIKNGKTGLLFQAGNADALADCLQNLITDQGLKKILQSNGIKWVNENHTWAKTTSVYKSIYRMINEH
ncbi:MAG: glycosyltransferase, exosortase A system-associated [Deltaproteobacteria bacterium]|nr:glycosyltransferase, exosortase A system-associated [Deltaproteobacteria bacterium]